MHVPVTTPSSRAALMLATLTLVAAGAQAQQAQQATSAATPGVMSFPHVRVEVAVPTAQNAPGDAQPGLDSPGMKAYKDAATGRLAHPTADQAAALEAADQARRAQRKGRKLQRAAAEPEQVPGGGVSVALDEADYVYAVAHKDAGGKVVEQCLPDQASAIKALSAPHGAVAAREEQQ